MAKAKDVGLEHIMKLHISAVRDERGIYNELARKYGQTKARELMDDIYGAAEREGLQALYDKKNEEYEIAMIFSGCYDADIVRKACNWINEHQEVFGDDILEIGCDCGFMTTFLGSLFPEKHIVAIDRNQSGIDIAKKNAEKFGLTNVEFLCVDASELEGKKFDTVFSMRTMQENGRTNDTEDLSNELVTQANIFTTEKQAYANSLGTLLKDNGKLVSIERLGRNALFLAWIQALTNVGLNIDLKSYSELKCMEVGVTETFEALIFTKEDCSDVDVFMSFMNCFANCMDTSLSQYDGWDAKIMYEFTGGKLVAGVEAHDMKSGATSRVACRIHKRDENCILWYQNYNGNVHLEYHDISEKDSCIESIQNAMEEARKIEYIQITEINE